MRKIKDDSEGYVFSLDLLLALIPLTILLGMATADMDAMFYLTQEGVYQSSLQRVATDAVSALLETSGTPHNWEETGNPSVVGIAKLSDNGDPIDNDISAAKLGGLNDTNIAELIGPEYGYFINITTARNNSPYYSIGTYNDSAPNIARVERLVQLAKFDIVSEGKGVRNPEPPIGSPRDFYSPPYPFKTNNVLINRYDYYVVVYNYGVTSASVDINGFPIIPESEFKKNNNYMIEQIESEKLKNGMGDPEDNSVVLSKVAGKKGTSFDVYIVRVPKGFPKQLIDIDGASPILGRFVMYVWVK